MHCNFMPSLSLNIGLNNGRKLPIGGFNPKSISGLDLWLDAADRNTLFDATSGGNLVSANGSAVKRWEDKSGNGTHATEATNAPTLATNSKNGLNTLNFNPSKYISCSFTSKTFTQQTVFEVLQFSTSSENYARAFTQTFSGSPDYSLSGHYVPILRNLNASELASYASGLTQSVLATTNQSWYIARARHSGSNLTLSLNGNSGSNFSHTLNRNFDSYRIGGLVISGDTSYWNSIISEVIVYTKSLTDSESNLVTNYLNTKWAVY